MQGTHQTIECFRISNGALAAHDLPKRLKILAWGVSPTVKGPVSLTELSARELPLQQAARGFDRVAIDFEHNTLEGHPNYERFPEPRRVAGYGVPRIVPNDGLYIEDIEWTPSGREFAREYYDLSPAPLLSPERAVMFLHSVALTRAGAVDDLHFYSVPFPASDPHKEHAMTIKPEVLTALSAATAALLGLDPEKASAAEVATAVTALNADLAKVRTALKTNPEGFSAAGSGGAAGGAAAPELTALSARIDASIDGTKQQITALAARMDRADKTRVLEQATAEGKVISLSAERIDGMSIADLTAYVKDIPPTVPLSQRTHGNPAQRTTLDSFGAEDAALASRIAGRAREIEALGVPFGRAFAQAKSELAAKKDD